MEIINKKINEIYPYKKNPRNPERADVQAAKRLLEKYKQRMKTK